jgi:hypothetical protein
MGAVRPATSSDTGRARRTAEALRRGDFVRLVYRLGHAGATGVLAVQTPRTRPEVLVIRRGNLMTADIDPLGRQAGLRLARLASLEDATWSFDGGTAAYPPGATQRQLSLAAWARAHLEGQVDAGAAERLLAELAGVRLAVRADAAPPAAQCDETDRRILAAMAHPRRLDQIWTLARTPRFRLLAFLHFLRGVDALDLVGVAAPVGRDPSGPVRAPGPPPREVRWDPARDHAFAARRDALRLLGIVEGTPPEAIKRAYRRLARILHPDLHPGVDDGRRRELEHKLAAVTAAYQQAMQPPPPLAG